ncbi:hypothetical protein ISS30_05530 [bacterium]|nr:hypothetical protein [bacterium]
MTIEQEILEFLRDDYSGSLELAKKALLILKRILLETPQSQWRFQCHTTARRLQDSQPSMSAMHTIVGAAAVKIGLLAGGDACQHSSWWCHASPHDTKILYLLCMVSTAESRHHNELNPKPQPLNPIFKKKSCSLTAKSNRRCRSTWPNPARAAREKHLRNF